MQKIILGVLVILILAGGGYYFYQNQQTKLAPPVSVTDATTTGATSTEPNPSLQTSMYILGTSTEGRAIIAYTYGSGPKNILFVGGTHGGYEWNTTLVAYELMDYLKANPTIIPAGVQVTVIPVMNPDGLFKVVGTTDKFAAADVKASQAVQISGRYNARTVDLNRNFDCDWKAKGKWQDTTVSGGKSVFSEPESAAIKKYTEALMPAAAVVWYSSAGGVYSSSCGAGILDETTVLTQLFANASGYPAHKEFTDYEISGDMVNWFAKMNIPAISVLLTNHTDVEWDKNKAGIDAIIKHFAQ